MPTFQQALDRITSLARDRGASITHTVQLLLCGGCAVTLFWDATESETSRADDLPRQCVLRFGATGDLLDGFVYNGHRYIVCLDEGLSHEQAHAECRDYVTSIDAVEAYLSNLPYRRLSRMELDRHRQP